MVYMVFKNLSVLGLWMKVVLALKGFELIDPDSCKFCNQCDAIVHRLILIDSSLIVVTYFYSCYLQLTPL